jgi:hypothetical protein
MASWHVAFGGLLARTHQLLGLEAQRDGVVRQRAGKPPARLPAGVGSALELVQYRRRLPVFLFGARELAFEPEGRT